MTPPSNGADMRYLAQSLATAGALMLLPVCLRYVALPAGLDPSPVPAAASTATSYTSATPRQSLPVGVRLPAGAVALGTPTTSEHRGDMREWRLDVRLAGTTVHAALDSLSEDLTKRGWDVLRGSTDVFAVRRAGDRWELFQAVLDPGHSPAFHGAVLAVGIGSRPA